MSVPIEAKSFVYTPPTLKGIEGAPTFTIRYGTRRDRHTFQQEIARWGVVSHTDDEIQATILSEMKRLSSNNEAAKEKMVLSAERFWSANKSLESDLMLWAKQCDDLRAEDPNAELPPVPALDFEPDEEAWITGIINQVSAASPLLGNMRADNVRREAVSREIALSIVLVSVDGFELRRRTDKIIEPDSLIELEEWLAERADELGVPQFSGDPYKELQAVAFSAFYLPKETEKNFASPPPIISDQNGLTSPETAIQSASKASAKSTSTQENSSPKPTSELSTSPAPVETDGGASNGQTAEP